MNNILVISYNVDTLFQNTHILHKFIPMYIWHENSHSMLSVSHYDNAVIVAVLRKSTENAVISLYYHNVFLWLLSERVTEIRFWSDNCLF